MVRVVPGTKVLITLSIATFLIPHTGYIIIRVGFTLENPWLSVIRPLLETVRGYKKNKSLY